MRRIYGLDTWRAALLVVGPLIHSAPSGYLSDASSLFRMPAFFFVAGFLGGHGAAKRPSWLTDRLVQLVLPTLVVWLFVLTPAKIIVGKTSVLDLQNPNHLWFLIDLAIATFAANFLARMRVFNKLPSNPSPPVMMFGYILLSTIVSSAIYPLDHISESKLIVSVAQAPIFAIHYGAGFIISNSEKYTNYAKNMWFFSAGLVLFVGCFAILRISHEYLNAEHQYRIIKLLVAGMKGLCGAVISMGVFASALRINWRPNFVHALSRSSYSIYLLHVPVILLVSKIMPSTAGEMLGYLILAFSGFFLPWIIHVTLFSKSANLMYLFNGVKRNGGGVVAGVDKQ